MLIRSHSPLPVSGWRNRGSFHGGGGCCGLDRSHKTQGANQFVIRKMSISSRNWLSTDLCPSLRMPFKPQTAHCNFVASTKQNSSSFDTIHPEFSTNQHFQFFFFNVIIDACVNVVTQQNPRVLFLKIAPFQRQDCIYDSSKQAYYNLIILKIEKCFYLEYILNQKPHFQITLNSSIYHTQTTQTIRAQRILRDYKR